MRHRLGIGAPDGREQQLVLHRATVDEHILMRGVTPVEGGNAGKAGKLDIFAHCIDLDGIILELGS